MLKITLDIFWDGPICNMCRPCKLKCLMLVCVVSYPTKLAVHITSECFKSKIGICGKKYLQSQLSLCSIIFGVSAPPSKSQETIKFIIIVKQVHVSSKERNSW